MHILIAVVLLAFCGFQTAVADQMTWRVIPNDQQSGTLETRTKQILTIAGNEISTKATSFVRTTSQAGEKGADGRVAVTAKVDSLQSELELPGGLRINFDSANPDKKADLPQLQPMLDMQRLHLKATTTTTFSDKGEPVDVQLNLPADETIPESFKETFDKEKRLKAIVQIFAMIPNKPVEVGATWEQTTDGELGAGQVLSVKYQCVYAGKTMKENRELHRVTLKPIEATYSMDPISSSALKVTNSQLEVSGGEGEVLFDNQIGTIVARNSTVSIKGKMDFAINDQTLPGSLTLTFTEKASIETK